MQCARSVPAVLAVLALLALLALLACQPGVARLQPGHDRL